MNPRSTIFSLMTSMLLLASCSIAAQDKAPALSANPFERPAWLGEARAAYDGKSAIPQHNRIDLRAILVAGDGSLANVGGKIIGIGEEVEGYVLISIAEGEAVFGNNGETLRVSVTGETEAKDDATE